LPTGYSPLPPGHVANVATFLEMTSRPATLAEIQADDLLIRQWQDPDLAAYRALFKLIGEPWLWQSRLFMPDAKLASIFRNPDIEIYRLFRDETVAGLLELDFTSPGECELSFFGLVPQEIGKGAGRFLERGHPARLGKADQAFLGAHLHLRSSGGDRLLQSLRLHAL
jgi:hypothetical protein